MRDGGRCGPTGGQRYGAAGGLRKGEKGGWFCQTFECGMDVLSLPTQHPLIGTKKINRREITS